MGEEFATTIIIAFLALATVLTVADILRRRRG
jgi:hypothetical protein